MENENHTCEATQVKCQLRNLCGIDYLEMMEYVEHLLTAHDDIVNIYFASIQSVPVSLNNLKYLLNSSSVFLTTLFQCNGEFFGLMFVQKPEHVCVTICVIPTISEIRKKFVYKLQLRSRDGAVHSRIGHIRQFVDANKSVEIGDCICVKYDAIITHLQTLDLCFDVAIFDSDGPPSSSGLEWISVEKSISADMIQVKNGIVQKWEGHQPTFFDIIDDTKIPESRSKLDLKGEINKDPYSDDDYEDYEHNPWRIKKLVKQFQLFKAAQQAKIKHCFKPDASNKGTFTFLN